MDSSTRHTVLKLFEQMIEWRKRKKTKKKDSVKFNWTQFHLSILHSYVFKLSLNSDFRVLSFGKLFNMPGSSTKDAGIVASFAKELQEFFIVPKKHQLFERDDTLKRNELMAAFINLLLQLLHHRGGSVNSVEDRIRRLEKELGFLLAVLGDKSLICDEENDKVQNLMAEFEAVANEAGILVHSVVFSTFADPVFKTIDEQLGALLRHTNLLEADIIKFSKLQPAITDTDITPKQASVDFLFIVDSLLYDLEDLLNREDDMIADVKDQMKELQHELRLLNYSFIKVSRHSEMEVLKEPVMRIRDVAYEAEYLIKSYLVGDAPLWYFSIRLSHVIHKIKLIETGVQETEKNYGNIIGVSKVAKNFSARLSLQNKRSSEVDDIVVGFEDKALDILDHLEGGKEHLQIISIFGMPGLGKTTLAKKLYSHPTVKYKFDICSWCVVSQTYHRKNLLIDILVGSKSELEKDKILKMDEESLVEHIYKSLKGRRYLIVMDDIWNSNAWDDVRRCFPDDGNGSRILFTSRNKGVAPPNSITYELPSMSDEKCWELLEKKVFKNEPCPPQLLETGKKIAANCRGVPLAVVVIAGVLSSMDKEGSIWKTVEGNLASYLYSDRKNSMMQVLELSYKHLPDHLKPCFLYFGAFPEDTEIPVRKLKWLWIVEGFIHKKETKSAESVAEEYLMELIDKSLVIVAKRRSDGGVKACVIHDLLRDVCLKRSEEENFLKLVDKNYSIYEKHHRLYLSNPKAFSQISPPFNLHIRSLFGFLQNSDALMNMKLLRVLDLLGIMGYDGNLNQIKHLVHLRYLAIKHASSSMDDLALIIGSLVNLEFLILETTYTFVEVPSIMMKMMKLRYLNFGRIVYFDEDCNNSQTNNLEFLSYVCIKNLKDEEMLKCSPHLRKLKCYCDALWAEEKGNYRCPDFRFFTQLESLNISNDIRYRMTEISLPSSIKRLTLSQLGLRWEKMSIIGGLPNLQVLKLGLNAFAGEIWETRDGEFQQLTFLKLGSIPFLKYWNVASSEHFPKLRQLVLDDCVNLQEISSEMGEIVTLELIEVKGGCLKSLVESARQIEQEQRDMGNEELSVIFTHIRERNMYDDRYDGNYYRRPSWYHW